MKQLKPLLYLTCRTVVNGVRRAVTSPKRLVYFLFFLSYYFFIFIRPTFTPSRFERIGAPTGVVGTLPFPPLEVIDAFAFAVFAVLSLFQMSTLSVYQTALRTADVDVLFPTPISPRLVLLFKIARD